MTNQYVIKIVEEIEKEEMIFGELSWDCGFLKVPFRNQKGWRFNLWFAPEMMMPFQYSVMKGAEFIGMFEEDVTRVAEKVLAVTREKVESFLKNN